MRDLEREAFRHGYKDYVTCALSKNASGFTSPFSRVWRPIEGHEDAYAAGWETARLRTLDERSKPRAA